MTEPQNHLPADPTSCISMKIAGGKMMAWWAWMSHARGASLTASGMVVTARQPRDYLRQQLEPWHILLEPTASVKAQTALVAVPTGWSLLLLQSTAQLLQSPMGF